MPDVTQPDLALTAVYAAGPDAGIPQRRDCCPVCGRCFEVVREVNVCPRLHPEQQQFAPDELITDSDDYAWCL